MSLFNLQKSEEVQIDPVQKLVILVATHYRFSQEEAHKLFGGQIKNHVTQRRLEMLGGSRHYAPTNSFLASYFNGNSDLCAFYGSLNATNLKKLLPLAHRQQLTSKGAIVEALVRRNSTIFPNLQKITPEILEKVDRAVKHLRRYISVYDPEKTYGQPFHFLNVDSDLKILGEHQSYWYHKPPPDYKERIIAGYEDLFDEGLFHFIEEKNSHGFCICLNPLIFKKYFEYSRKQIKKSIDTILADLPAIKVNPSAIKYHESRLNFARIYLYFNSRFRNEEMERTATGTLKRSDLRAFWKDFTQQPVLDCHVSVYDEVFSLVFDPRFIENKKSLTYENIGKILKGLRSQSKTFFDSVCAYLPLDKPVTFQAFVDLAILISRFESGNIIYEGVDWGPELLNINEIAWHYLQVRRLVVGDLDLEIVETKKGKKAEEQIKSLRMIKQESLSSDKEKEVEVLDVVLENNLTITLSPNTAPERILRLIEVFSFSGPSTLKLDEAAIYRLEKMSHNFESGIKYIQELLDRDLPQSALDFLRKNLPAQLSPVLIFPFHHVVVVSGSDNFMKVSDVIGGENFLQIGDSVMMLNPDISIRGITNKLKNRKFLIQICESWNS